MSRFAVGLSLLCLLGCGPEAFEHEAGGEPLRAEADATGIHRLEWRGTNLLEGVGGYYVIGTCTGEDAPAHNVISKGSDGRTLHAPGGCPGAPFSLSVTGDNPRRVSIRIGPLPVDYRGLSVPFDPAPAYFDRFRFSGDGYRVGCGASWSRRSGRGGAFQDIPQPCRIPGHGAVGVARVTSVPDGAWAEMSGPVATVRRRILRSNARELWFIRHPYTRNMEVSFSAEPVSQSILPAGSTYVLEEELWVGDPDAAAPPSGAAPSPTPGAAPGTPVDALYRAVLGRPVDPSGAATYGARVERGVGAMKAVARELLGSPEFRNAAPRGPAAFVDQAYRGLLGRAVDPAGRATFEPIAAAGDHARVIDGLLDSAEFRARFPGLGGGGGAPAPGTAPAPPPSSTAAATDLLAPLYLGLFARAPDPSGRATFGPALPPGDFDAMKRVGRQLMGSAEYAAVRRDVDPGRRLDRLYRGLLGRPVDPSGRGTFGPLVARGAEAEVLDALVDSPEHRQRY